MSLEENIRIQTDQIEQDKSEYEGKTFEQHDKCFNHVNTHRQKAEDDVWKWVMGGSGVGGVLFGLPGVIIGAGVGYRFGKVDWSEVYQKLEEYAKKIRETAQEIGEILTEWLFSPFYLAQSYGRWQQVAEDAYSISGAMNTDNVGNDVSWKGTGADAYKKTCSNMEKGGKATADLTSSLQDFLYSHLMAMIDLFNEFINIFAKFYMDTSKAAGSFVNIVNPLEWTDIIEDMISWTADVVSSLLKVKDNIKKFIQNDLSAMLKLTKSAATTNALPGGEAKWPKVSDFTSSPPYEPGWSSPASR